MTIEEIQSVTNCALRARNAYPPPRSLDDLYAEVSELRNNLYDAREDARTAKYLSVCAIVIVGVFLVIGGFLV